MKKVLSLFDKYTFCLWAIVINLVITITMVPFVPGEMFNLFGVSLYYTPILILSPVLMGIIYAIVASYETPGISDRKKTVFRAIKMADIIVFYAATIAVLVYAAVQGRINF